MDKEEKMEKKGSGGTGWQRGNVGEEREREEDMKWEDIDGMGRK